MAHHSFRPPSCDCTTQRHPSIAYTNRHRLYRAPDLQHPSRTRFHGSKCLRARGMDSKPELVWQRGRYVKTNTTARKDALMLSSWPFNPLKDCMQLGLDKILVSATTHVSNRNATEKKKKTYAQAARSVGTHAYTYIHWQVRLNGTC